MQNRITENLDYGIPGEFGKTNLRRVDAVEVAADIVMGGPAGRSSAGKIGPKDASTYTTFAGVFVTTHQHISLGTPAGGPLAPTLKVKAGTVVGLCSMGDVYLDIPVSVTAQTDATAAKAAIKALTFKAGDKIYVTSAGAYTTVAASNTLVGAVIEDRSCAEIADSDIVVTDGSDSKKNASASIVVMVRIG